jgi:uncharacterized protein
VSLSNQHPLRLNVGFMLPQNVGFSRTFDFDVPELHLGSDLALTTLRGTLTLTRTSQGVLVNGKLYAITPQVCSRCLSDFGQALTLELSELFVYPPSKASDPQLIISETGILDLEPIAREVFLLDIPIRPLCRFDCRGLCPQCGANRNEGECQHEEVQIDPRLELLRSLLNKSKG